MFVDFLLDFLVFEDAIIWSCWKRIVGWNEASITNSRCPFKGRFSLTTHVLLGSFTTCSSFRRLLLVNCGPIFGLLHALTRTWQWWSWTRCWLSLLFLRGLRNWFLTSHRRLLGRWWWIWSWLLRLLLFLQLSILQKSRGFLLLIAIPSRPGFDLLESILVVNQILVGCSNHIELLHGFDEETVFCHWSEETFQYEVKRNKESNYFAQRQKKPFRPQSMNICQFWNV